MDRLEGEGRLTISRQGGSNVHITVMDHTSGVRIVEVTMSEKEFLDCMFGLAFAECWIETPPVEILARIGMVKETKRVNIGVRYFEYRTNEEAFDKLIAAAVAEYADDGWELLGDGKKSQQPSGHQITLRRYV